MTKQLAKSASAAAVSCRGNRQCVGGEKKRGAWQNHKRLPYISINVYRTSLDHLLLGMDADIDRMSTGLIIKPFWGMSKIEFWIVAIFKMNRNRVTRAGGQWVSVLVRGGHARGFSLPLRHLLPIFLESKPPPFETHKRWGTLIFLILGAPSRAILLKQFAACERITCVGAWHARRSPD
jgi:hypothetical protein